MREDAILIEEQRLDGISKIEEYPSFHERHRVFPAVFEDRNHNKIMDISAGVGVVAQGIRENYPTATTFICNDISPTALAILKSMGNTTSSFDLDDGDKDFPFPDKSFDAIIALATIEHIINIDHFVKEIYRMLDDQGCLYLSAPNYAALSYMSNFLLAGKSFHDPLGAGTNKYEFYAHVRYFTYRTLVEFVSSFGFVPDTVYLPIPSGSTHYKNMYSRSKLKALTFRYSMWAMYKFLSPRWASEPVICFQKNPTVKNKKLRKVVL
jgi:ubiquinone/menaquinone biosynthesis C-methylase UbiE